jgi:transposase
LDWLLKGLNPLPVRRIKAAQPGTFYWITSV